MITIYPDTTIYVAAPANYATGGPELLHQLAYKLKNNGYKVSMYYYPNNTENPVHPFYKKYNIEFTKKIENSPQNILILPETQMLPLFDKEIKAVRKVIWWLSVDNYFEHFNQFRNRYRKSVLKSILNKFGALYYPELKRLKKKAVFNVSQSRYAQDFLQKNGLQEHGMLSDYLNSAFFELYNPALPKENIVLYNPKKGIEFTRQLIAAAPSINWVAIENMTPEQVAILLNRSKVYIDFGNHPGKDRFPREAAVMGCCIISGRQGSANFPEDLSIPDSYKFQNTPSAIPEILNRINDILINYKERSNDFNHYRNKIKSEENVFEQEIKELFSASTKL